jgi:uncharacterized protein YcbK (DUF882 family)
MSDFKYFKVEDFECKETGENEISVAFIHALDQLRAACGFPFIVNSGYRSKEHSVEKRKPNGGGTHTRGIAADIRVSGGAQRMAIVKHASAMGMSVGVAKTFVHVDIRKTEPMCWCY